jgi:hypothetical protein
MMTGCRSCADTLSKTVRAKTSTAPPALNGTMTRMGLSGQLCAGALLAKASKQIGAATRILFSIGASPNEC